MNRNDFILLSVFMQKNIVLLFYEVNISFVGANHISDSMNEGCGCPAQILRPYTFTSNWKRVLQVSREGNEANGAQPDTSCSSIYLESPWSLHERC